MTNGRPPDPTPEDVAQTVIEVAIEELEEFLAKYTKHRALPEVEAWLGPTLDMVAEALEKLKNETG